jgi:serine/threonine protein kinase
MERIGRYNIEEEIGHGGFGRVYRAHDPLMNREVAIKVMSSLDDPEMLARFRNEASSAGRLQHENIVTVYDFGEDRGRPFIVMQYMQGLDLQKVCDRKVPLSLTVKVRILCQVATGLQTAHENGIIHRDVKPANIMFLNDGSVKIMDFGIARLNQENATRHTRTGMVVGTLQYMAPEQFEGAAADVFSDLWAFGVIAYQLLAGQNPFEGGETAQIIYRITSTRMPDIRQACPGAPTDLLQVVNKLLQRDRAARYQSFEDVRLELKVILESLESQEASSHVDEARMLAARGDLTGAHQIVRQVLDRYPSHRDARQLRDTIVTQIRTIEANQQTQEWIAKGDQQFAEHRYDQAVEAYEHASRINPASSTARLRLERAKSFAERAHRVQTDLSEARSSLSRGDLPQADRLIAGILAEEPDHAEAIQLRDRIEQAATRKAEAARAEAVFTNRLLVSEGRFEEALSLLDTCSRESGAHPSVDEAREEVRRALSEQSLRKRLEADMARAQEYIRQGDYSGADAVLAPLLREFPGNAEVADLRAYLQSERLRAERLASRPSLAAMTAAPSAVPTPPDRETVIQRALEMSRQREAAGERADAIHVLDVALSRYPETAELLAERRRLSEPAIPPALPTLAISEPRPADAPLRRRAFRWRAVMWAGVSAVLLLAAGLAYRSLSGPGAAASSKEIKPSMAVKPQPAAPPVEPPPAQPHPEEAAPAKPPATETSAPAPRPLAEVLPPGLTIRYRLGDPMQPATILELDRTPLRASVTDGGNWLTAKTKGSRVAVSASPSSLSPGTHVGHVRLASGNDSAMLTVNLMVSTPPVEKSTATKPPVSSQAPGGIPTRQSDNPPAPEPANNAPPRPAQSVSSSTTATQPLPWYGAKRGGASWTGSMPPHSRVVLGSNSVLEGGGSLIVTGGQGLPTVPIKIDSVLPQLQCDVLPATSTQRVIMTNTGETTVTRIHFNWSVQ